MPNCKKASQLASRQLDSHLSFQERFALTIHLLICRHCMRISQQFDHLNVAISSMRKNIENDINIQLSSKAKERITKSIKSDMK